MNTSKYIEGIKAKVQAKIDALQTEAKEAYQNWMDTGYQRYMTKKERLETEADELDNFINPQTSVQEAWQSSNKEKCKKEELINILKNISSIVDEMKSSFPDCYETRRLENQICKFKDLLNSN